MFFSQTLATGGPSWSMLGNLFWAIRAAPQHMTTNCEARFSITVGHKICHMAGKWGTCLKFWLVIQ